MSPKKPETNNQLAAEAHASCVPAAVGALIWVPSNLEVWEKAVVIDVESDGTVLIRHENDSRQSQLITKYLPRYFID